MKVLAYLFSCIFFFALSVSSIAQGEDHWETYLAHYNDTIGSTVVNMSVKKKAPQKEFPVVLITGVTFSNCSPEGLPQKDQFDELYVISDSVNNLLARRVKNILVGSFTFQCQRLDYFYLKDTAGLRGVLEQLYAQKFKKYKPYINIKSDPNWDAYMTFLYPNKETLEYISNQKVVLQLMNAGDNLKEPRQVDHWIYFSSENQRACFEVYAKGENFKIESKETIKGSPRPYKLQISRKDKIELGMISALTLELRKQAENCGGDYDGWETFVVKE